MPYAPTITVYPDASPCPRAEVLFSSFAAGTASVTVTRTAEGRSFPVRGAVRAAVAGSLTRVDFEVPFGVTVSYKAEMFSAAGVSLGFTDGTSAIVEVPDSWIHNPLIPSGAVRVDIDNKSAQKVTREVTGEIVRPKGRRLGIMISSGIGGVVGVELLISTDTDAATDRFRVLLGDYDRVLPGVLCVRTPRQVRIPRVTFAGVLAISEEPVNAHLDGQLTEWPTKFDEVEPPTPALIVPLLRRKDIKAFYTTRLAVRQGNATRLAVNRRYDLAGTAG